MKPVTRFLRALGISTLLSCFAHPASAQSSDHFSVTITRTSGFWFPKQFHTITVDERKIVTLDFLIRTKQQLTTLATDADLAAIRVLLDKAGFFQLKDRYAQSEDGCEDIAADDGSLRIKVVKGDVTKTVTYYQGCLNQKLIELQTISQLFGAIGIVLDLPEWRELRAREWEDVFKLPRNER